jgi:hypothetical protein
MNDITMTNDINTNANLTIDTDIDTAALEAAEDTRFMNELSDFVATLPQPSAEAVARYEAAMTMLHNIREELGLNKVVVVDQTDDSVPYRGKYCDHAYSVSL